MDRAEISRRLKAARWLAGGVDEKGRPLPLSPEDLAQREQLKRNGITANAISEIERLVKDARPMELREISDALGLSRAWFTADEPAAESPQLARIEEMLSQLLGARGAPWPEGELGRRLQAHLQDGEGQPRPDEAPEPGARRGSGR